MESRLIQAVAEHADRLAGLTFRYLKPLEDRALVKELSSMLLLTAILNPPIIKKQYVYYRYISHL